MNPRSQPIRTLAILQARLSSSRLPGKVLMPVHGMPLIGFMIERIRQSRTIDHLVVATSTEMSDDPLVEAVSAMGIAVVRGPLDDVLARFALAESLYPASVVVRLTGDCPLIEPRLIDRVVASVISGHADYASNCVPATYPDGLDCEAFRADILRRAASEALLPSEREHVTPWIRSAAGGRTNTIKCNVDLSKLRWTVDYEDDLQLIRQMVERLGERAMSADLYDILRAYDEIGGSSSSYARNEGYQKSLASDAPLA